MMIFPDTGLMKKYYLRKPNKFYFSDDSSYRNLYLTFENDSIMCVSNSSLPFSRRSFIEYYKYYMNSPSQIIVAELIRSSKSNKVFPEFVNCIKADTTTGYVLPFRDRDFYSQAEIFPNISGDTIFCFSYDLYTIKKSEYLQVGCFVFKNRYDIEEELTKEEKHSEITPESEQKPVVLPQYLDSAIRNFDFQKFVIRKNRMMRHIKDTTSQRGGMTSNSVASPLPTHCKRNTLNSHPIVMDCCNPL